MSEPRPDFPFRFRLTGDVAARIRASAACVDRPPRHRPVPAAGRVAHGEAH